MYRSHWDVWRVVATGLRSVCEGECVTSLSVTEAEAASAAVGFNAAEFIWGPEEEEARTVAGVETATGTVRSKPCWLTVLDTDD